MKDKTGSFAEPVKGSLSMARTVLRADTAL